MEEIYLDAKYFSEEKQRRLSKQAALTEFEIVREERSRQIEKMQIIYQYFLNAVERHTLNFFISTIKKSLKDKPNNFTLLSSPQFKQLLTKLFLAIPVNFRKHLGSTNFGAHKRNSTIEDSLPFEDYILFELPPVCIDKAIREILGYIAPRLIKNKFIVLNSNDEWALGCRGNYILHTNEYNWSNEMTKLILSYKGHYLQLKMIDEQIYSLKLFMAAA